MNKAQQEIVDKIIEQIEAGVCPWRKPWITGGIVSHCTGKVYSALNRMLLKNAGEYITFHQVSAEGGRIKKGEKGQQVFFGSFINKTKDGEPVLDSDGNPDRYYCLKRFYVWSVEQTEGIERKYPEEAKNNIAPNEAAREIIKKYLERSGVKAVTSDQDKSFFSPSEFKVSVPPMGRFQSTAGFYSTLFHELVHSTGAAMSRDLGDGFGTKSYSREELVAEIGSSMLMAKCGMLESIPNSAAYLSGWASALKEDKTISITYAASKADKAVNYILTGEK